MRYLGRDFLLAKKLLNWEFRVALPNRSTDIKTVSKEVLQPYYKILLFNFEFFCYGNAHCIKFGLATRSCDGRLCSRAEGDGRAAELHDEAGSALAGVNVSSPVGVAEECSSCSASL